VANLSTITPLHQPLLSFVIHPISKALMSRAHDKGDRLRGALKRQLARCVVRASLTDRVAAPYSAASPMNRHLTSNCQKPLTPQAQPCVDAGRPRAHP
jgi:hypothetical protein